MALFCLFAFPFYFHNDSVLHNLGLNVSNFICFVVFVAESHQEIGSFLRKIYKYHFEGTWGMVKERGRMTVRGVGSDFQLSHPPFSFALSHSTTNRGRRALFAAAMGCEMSAVREGRGTKGARGSAGGHSYCEEQRVPLVDLGRVGGASHRYIYT